MFKKAGVALIVLIFTGSIFTSCSKAHEVCDAYTYQLKIEKIKNVKETAVLNIPNVHN